MNPSGKNSDIALLDALVERGAMAQATKMIVAKYAERWDCGHFDALIEAGVVSESDIADVLAMMVKATRVHGIASQLVAPEVLETVPYALARELQAIPIGVFEDTGKIEVAVANPADQTVVDRLRRATPREIVLAVGERSDIVSAIDGLYPLKDRWPTMWDCVKSQ